MTDPMRENIERWRRRGAAAVGGPYGQSLTRLGHRPVLKIVTVVDAVILDSTQAGIKLHSTQAYPLEIEETVTIAGGTDFNKQVIAKFSEPINNIRNISVPLITPNGINSQNGTPPPADVTSTGALYFNLLRVDLNSGVFKLEDLTFDLAHQVVRNHTSVSSLYAAAGNFRKEGGAAGNTFPSFLLGPRNGRAFRSPTGTGVLRMDAVYGSGTEDSGSYWFYGNRFPDTRIDADLGPYTGIHLYMAPTIPAGATPAPSAASDSATIQARLPDPKPASTGSFEGRFPFVVGTDFEVVIG